MNVRESRWRELLALALPALDHVFDREAQENDPAVWTLGGGTAIALHIDHRVSYDVDLFVPAIPLKRFAPANNPAALRISSSFQWPGHYLRFERPEGEIDFLSSALQTEPGYGWMQLLDRRLAVETPEEVIVKKIRFRGTQFTARDVFDLAAVATIRSGLAETLAREVPDMLAPTRESVDLHAARGPEALAQSVVTTAAWHDRVGDCFEIGRRTLDRASELDAS